MLTGLDLSGAVRAFKPPPPPPPSHMGAASLNPTNSAPLQLRMLSPPFSQQLPPPPPPQQQQQQQQQHVWVTEDGAVHTLPLRPG